MCMMWAIGLWNSVTTARVDWRCCCLVAQLCLPLCDPTACSPPGSSVHGMLQPRILEWVAISISRGLSIHILVPVSFKCGIPEMEKVTQLRLLLCFTVLEVIHMLNYDLGTYQNQAVVIRTDWIGMSKMVEYHWWVFHGVEHKTFNSVIVIGSTGLNDCRYTLF